MGDEDVMSADLRWREEDDLWRASWGPHGVVICWIFAPDDEVEEFRWEIGPNIEAQFEGEEAILASGDAESLEDAQAAVFAHIEETWLDDPFQLLTDVGACLANLR